LLLIKPGEAGQGVAEALVVRTELLGLLEGGDQ